MIVLDEQLSWPFTLAAIRRWYPGNVINVLAIRPHKRTLDSEIPFHLLRLRQPTFVTINFRDFQPLLVLHQRYCIIRLKLGQPEISFVPPVLRSILLEPQFNTKAKRMGKVISWTKEGGIDFIDC